MRSYGRFAFERGGIDVLDCIAPPVQEHVGDTDESDEPSARRHRDCSSRMRRSRRDVVGSAVSASLGLLAGFGSHPPDPSLAVYNPLNLKGSYWETGELYQKKESSFDLPPDPEALLSSMKEMASALESLSTVAEGGEFDELSRALRGGSVSESRLRISGNALIDSILEDDREYVVAERFRLFLNNFDALDAAVTAAARRSSADGGILSTLALSAVAPLSAVNRVATIANEPRMGSDPRLEVLGSLDAAVKSLRAFIKAAGEAIAAQQ